MTPNNVCKKCGDDLEGCKCGQSTDSGHGTHPQTEEILRRYVYELTASKSIIEEQVKALLAENEELKTALSAKPAPMNVLDKLRSDICTEVNARRIHSIKEAEVTACQISRKQQLEKVSLHEETLRNLGADFEPWVFSWERAKCQN